MKIAQNMKLWCHQQLVGLQPTKFFNYRRFLLHYYIYNSHLTRALGYKLIAKIFVIANYNNDFISQGFFGLFMLSV